MFSQTHTQWFIHDLNKKKKLLSSKKFASITLLQPCATQSNQNVYHLGPQTPSKAYILGILVVIRHGYLNPNELMRDVVLRINKVTHHPWTQKFGEESQTTLSQKEPKTLQKSSAVTWRYPTCYARCRMQRGIYASTNNHTMHVLGTTNGRTLLGIIFLLRGLCATQIVDTYSTVFHCTMLYIILHAFSFFIFRFLMRAMYLCRATLSRYVST